MGVISNLFPLDYALNLNYYWFYYYEELNGIQLHGRTFRFSLNAQRRCKQLLNPPETDIFRTHTHTHIRLKWLRLLKRSLCAVRTLAKPPDQMWFWDFGASLPLSLCLAEAVFFDLNKLRPTLSCYNRGLMVLRVIGLQACLALKRAIASVASVPFCR